MHKDLISPLCDFMMSQCHTISDIFLSDSEEEDRKRIRKKTKSSRLKLSADESKSSKGESSVDCDGVVSEPLLPQGLL